MGRTTYDAGRPAFLADLNAYDQDGGHQIDWASIADSYKNSEGKKVLPAGKAMNITAGGKLVVRVATTAPAECLLISEAVEGATNHARTGYGVVRSGVVYEQLLPDKDDAAWAAIKTELNAQGRGFDFIPYSDSRAV